MANLAFIGLGIMGSPMAVHLQNAGYHVSGYNKHRDRSGPLVAAGGTRADSIAAAVADAEIVAVMVPDSPDRVHYLAREGCAFLTIDEAIS